MECIFCEIAAGNVEADVVYSDDDIVVFRDRNPQAPVHLLAIPKRHVTSPSELTGDDIRFLAAVPQVAAQKLPEGFRLMINEGQYQEVPHLHVHILGGGALTETQRG